MQSGVGTFKGKKPNSDAHAGQGLAAMPDRRGCAASTAQPLASFRTCKKGQVLLSPPEPGGGGQDGAGAGSDIGGGGGAGFFAGAGFIAGAGIFAGAAFTAGALRLGAAFFATFFGAFFAVFFAADFTVFFFLCAGAAFFFVNFFFAFDFDFFAMIVLPIDATSENPVGPHGRPGSRHNNDRAPIQLAAADGRIADRGRCSPSAGGHGPPVAQSINSTVWTAGSFVPAAICVMQPMFPAAITSGRTLSIVLTLRSRNLLAISDCRILYVPAEPQHKWPSGTSFTT